MKHTSTEYKSTRLGLLFCFLLIFLVLVSLGYKGVQLFNRSLYDDTYEFTFSFRQSFEKQEIIALDPLNKKVQRILITSKKQEPVTKALEIPVDTEIVISYNEDLEKPLQDLLKNAIFHPHQVKTSATIIDLIRIYFLVSTIPSEDVEFTTFPADTKDIDKEIGDKLLDEVVVQENKSVHIINATGESGIGSNLEQALKRTGMLIVAVTTARKTQENTTIFATEESYTSKKMQRLFGITPQKQSEDSVSDIIITLGKKQPYLLY